MKGSRVQNVVQELRGEKIDIISWHIDPAKFVCNALAPAEVSRVIIDEENTAMEVIVPDEFLSIAIGKRGLNVRLASKLTKWHLDVISEDRYNETMKDGYNSLIRLPGIGISLADALYEEGFYSADELRNASVEDLIQIRGIGEDKAKMLIETAENNVTDLVENNETYESIAPDESTEPASSDTQETPEIEIDNGEGAEGQADPQI
jgi:N utilization substance protein A